MRSTTMKPKEKTVDPDSIMDGLAKELNANMKAMAKTNSLDEKERYSRIVKNLCESLGVFLKMASDMMHYEFDDEDEQGDLPF